jgi:hypothetical protein
LEPTPSSLLQRSQDATATPRLIVGPPEWISPDTPSPILMIPVTNVPSYVHRETEIA